MFSKIFLNTQNLNNKIIIGSRINFFNLQVGEKRSSVVLHPEARGYIYARLYAHTLLIFFQKFLNPLSVFGHLTFISSCA